MAAPIAAWIAIRGSIAWPPVWLGLAVLFWVAGFDVIYACQDADFDRQGRPAQPARSPGGRAGLAAGGRSVMPVMVLPPWWGSA